MLERATGISSGAWCDLMGSVESLASSGQPGESPSFHRI